MDFKTIIGKKVMPFALVSLLAATSAVPAMAASPSLNSSASTASDYVNDAADGKDISQGQYSESNVVDTNSDSKQSAQVYVTQSSTFDVTIPKTLVIDGKATINSKYGGTINITSPGYGVSVVSPSQIGTATINARYGTSAYLDS